jgi:N-acetylglucosamine-6-phosphate deacetylase
VGSARPAPTPDPGDDWASGWRMRVRGRVVTPEGVVEDAVVRIRNDRIDDITVAPRGRSASERGRSLSGAWVVPGFVDLHVHGGGGYSFTAGDVAQARGAIAFHRRHGTTTMLASLVTAPRRDLYDQTARLAPLVHSGELAGVHLEGPYLADARRGAHDPRHLRDPDPAELAELIALDAVRVVTLAPERPGGLAAIEQLRAHGVVVAIGHTDATYEQALAAVTAGAGLATHLYNGMRPIHHRDPGPVVALLESPGVVCEVVADGVHLHDGILRHTVRVAGPDRVALVTDAIAAAGMPDGAYELGGLPITVADGVARLTGSGSIAGSTTTMAAAFRRTVRSGVSIVEAARMAATTPAAVLGLGHEVGAIAPGMRADLVVLDEDLAVIAVVRAGQLVTEPAGPARRRRTTRAGDGPVRPR